MSLAVICPPSHPSLKKLTEVVSYVVKNVLENGSIEKVSPYQMEFGIYNWYLLTFPLRLCAALNLVQPRTLWVSIETLLFVSFVRSDPEDESLEECSTAEAADCVSWCRIRLDAEKFLSWTVVDISGVANLAANILSRQGRRPWELRLYALSLIWKQFGRVEVYLFLAKQFNVFFGSLTHLWEYML